MVIEMINPALVLTTVNAPYNSYLDADGLAKCLMNEVEAKAMPAHMSSFFGEVQPELQQAFAELYGISSSQLVSAAKSFANYSGELYPLAA